MQTQHIFSSFYERSEETLKVQYQIKDHVHSARVISVRSQAQGGFWGIMSALNLCFLWWQQLTFFAKQGHSVISDNLPKPAF